MNASDDVTARAIGISVVLPAYDEEKNIGSAVERADRAVKGITADYEIIVVNDGSRDGTAAVLDRLAHRYPSLRVVEHRPNRGYGAALRSGFDAATKPWIFQSDSDNQFDYAELALLVERAPAHDFVVGYRQPRRDPLIRRLNGWGWNTLIRLLFGYITRDIDCAFRLFRRAALERVPLASDGAMVSTELLVGAKKRGFRFAELRVTHLPRQTGHATGARPAVIARAIRDLLRYRIALTRQLRAERTGGQPEAVRSITGGGRAAGT
jgi:glycosyltransferase involved in cell wall biosynthesis